MEANMKAGLKYTATAKWLHWFIALVVIVMLVFGLGLEDMEIPELTETLMVHSGLGTLVLILMLLRLGWRKTHRPPMPETSISNLQVQLSHAMHWALYILLIIQPVLGILQAAYIDEYKVIAFGLIDYSAFAVDNAGTAEIFHSLHSINATLISVLVIAHIGVALYHHFVLKDQALKKMIPFGKVE